MGLFPILEKFQLLSWSVGGDLFLLEEKFYLGELFVGDGEKPHLPIVGQCRLYALQVYGGILAACAVADIDGELEHGESVRKKVFAEIGCSLTLLLGFGGEVKKHEQPHDAVFAEAIHVYNSG